MRAWRVTETRREAKDRPTGSSGSPGVRPETWQGWLRADVGVRFRLVLLCRSTGVKDSIQDEKALLAAGSDPAAAVVTCPARIRGARN